MTNWEHEARTRESIIRMFRSAVGQMWSIPDLPPPTTPPPPPPPPPPGSVTVAYIYKFLGH